jgi:hypothetical protein
MLILQTKRDIRVNLLRLAVPLALREVCGRSCFAYWGQVFQILKPNEVARGSQA